MRKPRKDATTQEPLTAFQTLVGEYHEQVLGFQQFVRKEFVNTTNVNLYHQASMVEKLEIKLDMLIRVTSDFTRTIVEESTELEVKSWNRVQTIVLDLIKEANKFLDATSLRQQASALTDFVEYTDLLVTITER